MVTILTLYIYSGIYDKWIDHTLYLVIDVKTGDDETWKRVIDAVEPL